MKGFVGVTSIHTIDVNEDDEKFCGDDCKHKSFNFSGKNVCGIFYNVIENNRRLDECLSNQFDM